MEDVREPSSAARCAVGAEDGFGGYKLVATMAVPPGTPLIDIAGDITATPTRYSVQVGTSAHIDAEGQPNSDDLFGRYAWRFTNHSCEPNAVIRDRRLVAMTRIEPWQEITFNYNTTEYDMAEPFECRCASTSCVGAVSGFRYLSTEDRQLLLPLLAQHLVPLLADNTHVRLR